MKLIYASVTLLVLSIPTSSWGTESRLCTEEQRQKIMVLYENRDAETAKAVFQILSCGGYVSKESHRGQLVALIGGYMRTNPSLIEHLYNSANAAGNRDSEKLFIDGLWFCSTGECRAKLKEQPFQLSEEDVISLLAESPPDPYSIPIDDPATLDLLWGYLFGSGDTLVVGRVYNLLAENWQALQSSGSIGLDKRIVLTAAHWSLVSIASQQELVRGVLEKENSNAALELLNEITHKLRSNAAPAQF